MAQTGMEIGGELEGREWEGRELEERELEEGSDVAICICCVAESSEEVEE